MTFARLGERVVHTARLHVPAVGAWVADVVVDSDDDVRGRVTLTLGDLDLVGTVVGSYSGSNGAQRVVRIVAGGAGWGEVLPPRHYHSDAGVLVATVAADAAREVGEELATLDVDIERVGSDYVRSIGPASRALEDAIGGTVWWVDAAGRTHVGARSLTTTDPTSFQELSFDPASRVLGLASDRVAHLWPGAVIESRLDGRLTVREIEVIVEGGQVRMHAWCGADPRGRLAGAVRRVVERATDARLFGVYRYRVVQRSVDRLELQAIRRDAGLPDVLPVSMVPGVAGAHASVALGAVVYVEFVEGQRTMPIVRGFAGKDEAGHVPDELTFSVSAQLRLADATATRMAAVAEAVAAELADLATTLSTAAAPSGGGAVTYGTPYTPPSASSIGAPKVRVP